MLRRLMVFTSLVVAWSVAQGASFDCSKASSPMEKTICADEQLSALDSKLMEAYKKSLSASAQADVLKAEQRAWLKDTKNQCQDAACLKDAYAKRIATLDAPATATVPSEAAAPQKDATPPTTEAAPVEAKEASNPAPVQPIPVAKTEATPPANTASEEKQQKGKATSEPKEDMTRPSPGLTAEIFNVIFLLLLLVLLAGLVKPGWVLRWDSQPNRKKVLAVFGGAMFACHIASQATQSDAHRAFVKKEKAAEQAAANAAEVAKNRAQAAVKAEKALDTIAQDRLKEFSLAANGGMCDEIRDVAIQNKLIGTMDNARPGGESANLPAGVFEFTYTCVMKSYGRKDTRSLLVSVANDTEFGMIRCVFKVPDSLRAQFNQGVQNCGFRART